jgi:DNA-binding FadR family transcriptional regulator
MSPKAPLYKRGQEEIRQFILDNQLVAGDALPSEAEMSARLGMSRLSLREAVRGLEMVGVLTVQHGGSVRVAEFSFGPILENLPYGLQANSRSFRDMLELRESLEEGLVSRLLQVLRPRDLDRLNALAVAMADVDGDQSELDRRFHEELYRPLENPLVSQIIETFWQAFHRMRGSHDVPVPTAARLSETHLAIVEALRARDDDALELAMRDHFADIRNWAFVHYSSAD